MASVFWWNVTYANSERNVLYYQGSFVALPESQQEKMPEPSSGELETLPRVLAKRVQVSQYILKNHIPTAMIEDLATSARPKNPHARPGHGQKLQS